MQSVCIQKPHHKQEKNYTCVPASVRMMLAFHGIERTESYLARILKTKFYGTNVYNILYIEHERIGLEVRSRFFSLGELKQKLFQNQPCIVPLRTKYLSYFPYDCLHTLVVVGYDDEGNILVNEPNFDAAIISIKESEFVQAWAECDGLVILIQKAS
jgi:ABC-type bacteriocin/lantibiotic exporter with double-glycine peptidase domain